MKKTRFFLSFALAVAIFAPLSARAGGSIEDYDEGAAYYVKHAEDEAGRSGRLDVGYVERTEQKTQFGEANLILHTFVENIYAGSALLIAGDAADELAEKYGEQKPGEKERVRTRSLRGEFLGLDGEKKMPVFRYD